MIKLIKIPGEQNPSDVLTKYVKAETINKFLDRLGIEYRVNSYDLSNVSRSINMIKEVRQFETGQAFGCIGSAVAVDLVKDQNLEELEKLKARIKKHPDFKAALDCINHAIKHCKRLRDSPIFINEDEAASSSSVFEKP